MRNYICIFLVVCLPLTLASETQHQFKVYVHVGGDNETQCSATVYLDHNFAKLR